ncbi:MAG: tetratricopeptide repeat protein [Candidatus Poribacteria bacterium]|nr:tetratricopeptide repeat protein [Candidatus Poribacteria bacterium]MDE0503055.1 tetratricopeptide repeat protein [Candidatus Poribacteria bacterium]
MIFKSISYWLWFIILAALGLALIQVPLFNLLAYESCAVLAIAISFAGAYISVTGVHRLRRSLHFPSGTSHHIVITLFWRTFGSSLTLLIAPLVILSLNALRVENCDLSDGFAFFFLLPVISCAYATAAGLFFGFWMKRRWGGYSAYLAYILVTFLTFVYNLVFHPPVFGFHAAFGYFPGPIYDEQISITGSLLIARGTALLLAWLFLTISIIVLESGRRPHLVHTLNWRKVYRFKLRFADVYPRIQLIVLACLLLLIYLNRGELGLRPTRGYIENALGGLHETEHFKIFYEKGSKVEREIERIARDHEFRYAQLIDYLRTQPSRKVNAYIYTSPEQKKHLIGAGHTLVEDPFGYGFHVNYEPFPHPIIKHELVHALTTDWHPFFKVSLKLGLHEGIAVAANWNEGKLTPHQWSRAMRESGVAPSIGQIMGFGFWAQASSRSYMLAGSFVRYVVEAYGIEAFKRAFPTGNFRAAYGKSLSELTSDWETFLDTVPLTTADLTAAEHRLKRGSIFQKRCAHEIAELSAEAWKAYRQSDFAQAIRLFDRIHEFDPDNPRHLRGLMHAHFRTGDYTQASQWARKIIAHPAATTRQIADAKNVGGDMDWGAGNRESARTHYQEVSALNASDALNREAYAKLETLSLESPTARSRMKQVLIGRESSATRINLLHEVVDEMPEWGLAFYLIGRQLHLDGQYAASNDYLLKAAAFGLPHRVLKNENSRLFAINLYHLRQYDGAIAQFRRLSEDDDLPLGSILSAEDWIERCEWEKQGQLSLTISPLK